MLVLAWSTVCGSAVPVCFGGLGLFGLSWLFSSMKRIDANSLLKGLNLVTAAESDPLFVRYRALNFFGEVAGCVPFLCVLFPVLILVCAAAATLLYARGAGGLRAAWADALIGAAAEKLAVLRYRLSRLTRGRGWRTYSRSLVLAELFKTLISTRFLAVVLLILCVKVCYSVRVNSPPNSFSDAVYREYMTVLEGEMTDEKLAYIADERARIDLTLSRYAGMRQAYLNGEITYQEYGEFLSEYNDAYSRSSLFGAVERQADYLLRQGERRGAVGWFLYDTGWRKLYAEDADLFLYASILLLFTGSFAAEYVSRSSSGRFAELLRSTKKGRHRTFHAKLISSGAIAAALTVLTGAADAAVVFSGYAMPCADAPLWSVAMFSDVTGGITVGQYFVLFFLMRLTGALIMAMLVCALSELLARYLPVLGAAVALTLLPALCAAFGFAAADKVNFLNLLAGTPLFLESARTPLLGSGYAMLALWLAAAVSAVAAMMLPAKKMFTE